MSMGNVKAFIPGRKFPDISITGLSCPLNCAYCEAYYLHGMESAPTPKKLYETVRYLVKKGAKGVLISGGFNLEGKLPIEPFLNIIREIKRDFDIVISVHQGLVDRNLAEKLRDAKVDIVDYEVILDPFVIKNVKNLKNKEPEDYIKSFEILEKYGPPYIAPHIPLGLNYGKIAHEFDVIDKIIEFDPYILVFLIFIPTKGTKMENSPMPEPKDIINVIKYARKKFKRTLALGCMRPWKLKYLVDPYLIEKDLVERITNPPKSVIKKYGLETVEACCSVPKELLERFI